ncbi:MAG: TetR/AcrR family transcriptional regulator [Blastocatellia bacterium]|nr:TetR/AcrR family transcriptional regulator [Blastocatellia bacterium]
MVTRLTQQNQIQEKILDTAAQLFYEKGLQAVGVDEIVLQAGIAKMTLYKYFLSKDQLILAVVERSEEKWWNWFTTKLYQRSKLPKKQLLIIFDLLFSSFQETNYRGEPFINAQIRVLDTMYPIF